MNTFSVVICAYTLDRWIEMMKAVKSVQHQTLPPYEIILVIDHNRELYERARKYFSDVVVHENSGKQGLSGARNTGIAAAGGNLLAFMDEDAVADPDWLERLGQAYSDREVMGVGGAIQPMWAAGRPTWFPEEFDWVVGCTYLGMPLIPAPVRNLIGCNMSFRRDIFEGVGGFRDGIGRIGTVPLGCEETEFCIRARQHWPRGQFIYDPRARVSHLVPRTRGVLKYFLARCYAEGLSKALVASLVGANDGLDTERTYVWQTLPGGVLRSVRDAFISRRPAKLGRAAAIIIGLTWTIGGYIAGKSTIPEKRELESRRGMTTAFNPPAPGREEINY